MVYNLKSSPWTDERVELMKKLNDESMSTSQIAAELGGGITRNAVLGYLHRKGIPVKNKRPGGGFTSRKPTKAKKNCENKMTSRVLQFNKYPKVNSITKEVEIVEPKAIELKETPEEIGLHYSMDDLNEYDCRCRWPTKEDSEGKQLFCAERTEGTRISFCNFHRKSGRGLSTRPR